MTNDPFVQSPPFARVAVTRSEVRRWLSVHRRLATGTGIGGLLALGFSGAIDSDWALGMLCLVAFSVAVALGWAEVLTAPRHLGFGAESIRQPWTRRWWVVTVVAVGAPALAVQTWFTGGTVAAGGDVPPPVGPVSMGRLFAATVTSGSDIGIVNGQETSMPWVLVVDVVHYLGGSPALAQRIWFTFLLAMAGLAALLCLRVLGIGPVGACLGALTYVGNAYVVSSVGFNAVYLAALALLPLYPAIALNVAYGRLSLRVAAVLLAATGPLLGYTYSNPPLVGMILIVLVASSLLAWWLAGRAALRRVLRFLAVGGGLLLLVSAYWIVPVAEQVPYVASGSLRQLDGWVLTEARATLANAFWLNTSWSWPSLAYTPYSPMYERFPLDVLRFMFPAAAFGALAVTSGRRSRRDGAAETASNRLPLVLPIATAALLVIFLSTGTRPPGSILFMPLYNLPGGYLLREPGVHFFMVVALAYSVMCGVSIELLSERLRRTFGKRLLAFHHQSRKTRALGAMATGGALAMVAVLLTGAAYPLATGAVVPAKRPFLPPFHVSVPAYWPTMASYIDALPEGGTMLVLPSDDFYMMPYTWGYYGTDGFIFSLMSRPTLIDAQGGYLLSPPPTLHRTVSEFTDALLAGDWAEASALIQVVGNELILVRGDVEDHFPGRTITSPRALSAALQVAPGFRLIHREGPLELFRVSRAPVPDGGVPQPFATVSSTSPDLGTLALLPPGTHLVSSAVALDDHPRVTEAPPLDQWSVSGDQASTRLGEPAGWSYELGVVAPRSTHIVGPVPVGSSVTVASNLHASTSSDGVHLTVDLGPNLIDDGTFGTGPWSWVGDCDAKSDPAVAGLHAAVGTYGPHGGPALELSAVHDSACEAQDVHWTGEPILLSLQTQHIAGTVPRICLWEIGLNRCARIPDLETSSAWTEYHTVVVPEPGTTGLTLYLYADADAAQHTVARYADVGIHAMPSGAQGRILLRDSRVADAQWDPVGDCNAQHDPASADLHAERRIGDGPNSAAFVRLSSRMDSACVSEPLTWFGGRLQFEMTVRHVSGAAPRVCLWEDSIRRCAPLSAPLPSSADWSRYEAVVTPDPGATALHLYLYADAPDDGSLQTVDDYAEVMVTETEGMAHAVLLGTPNGHPAERERLYEIRSGFSGLWSGGPSAQQVLVDGLFSGWLVSATAGPPDITFRPQKVIEMSFVVSCMAAALAIALALWSLLRGVRQTWWSRFVRWRAR